VHLHGGRITSPWDSVINIVQNTNSNSTLWHPDSETEPLISEIKEYIIIMKKDTKKRKRSLVHRSSSDTFRKLENVVEFFVEIRPSLISSCCWKSRGGNGVRRIPSSHTWPLLLLLPPLGCWRYSLMISTPRVEDKLVSQLARPQPGAHNWELSGRRGRTNSQKALGKFSFLRVGIDGGERERVRGREREGGLQWQKW